MFVLFSLYWRSSLFWGVDLDVAVFSFWNMELEAASGLESWIFSVDFSLMESKQFTVSEEICRELSWGVLVSDVPVVDFPIYFFQV